MITSIFELCQKVNFKLNLFELLIGFAVLFLIKVIIYLARKLLHTIRTNSIIDERMRERRNRIARVASEIDYTVISDTKVDNPGTQIAQTLKENEKENKFETSKLQATVDTQKQIIKNSKQFLANKSEPVLPVPNEGQITSDQVISEEGSKKKKTRAMSMEERWADFEKKRAAQNSA